MEVRLEGVINQNSGDHQLWENSGRSDKEETKKDPLEGQRAGKAWRHGSQEKGKFSRGSISRQRVYVSIDWQLGGPW